VLALIEALEGSGKESRTRHRQLAVPSPCAAPSSPELLGVGPSSSSISVVSAMRTSFGHRPQRLGKHVCTQKRSVSGTPALELGAGQPRAYGILGMKPCTLRRSETHRRERRRPSRPPVLCLSECLASAWYFLRSPGRVPSRHRQTAAAPADPGVCDVVPTPVRGRRSNPEHLRGIRPATGDLAVGNVFRYCVRCG